MPSDSSPGRAIVCVGLLLSACNLSAEGAATTLIRVPCVGTAVTDAMEPLDRPGLSAVRCQPPYATEALLLITDENITWPVIEEGTLLQSLEEQVLAGAASPGGGHAYHDERAAWAVLRADQTIGFVYRVQSSDPVTLEPVAGFVAVATDPASIRGTARAPEEAAALIASSQ